MPSMNTLQELLPMLQQRGDQPGLIMLQREGSTTYGYRELATSAESLALGVLQAGIKPGEFVALLAKNRPEWIIACLATIHSGAAVIPLDTQIATDALHTALTNSDARLIFTTTEYLNRLQQLDLPNPPRIVLLDVPADDPRSWHALRHDPARNGVALPQVQPDDPAAMFYTSALPAHPKAYP